MTDGRDVYWDELPTDPEPVDTADTEPNDPVIIVYTSGTTGAPKGIVHSHGGLAVKCGVDFAYGFDVHRGDVVAWIADIGWMLYGVLLIGVLQHGATIVLTEGVPTYPSRTRLWEIIERNGVTLQGIAPTAARAVMAATRDEEIAPGPVDSRRVRLHRRGMGRAHLAVAVRRGRQGHPPDRQLQRRHRGSRWDRRLLPVPGRRRGLVQRAPARHGRRRRSTRPARRSSTRSGNSPC